MAVTFTGTSTGKTYVAGQSYVTGTGVVKVAQQDGTFKNVKTGQVSVGSSKDPKVTWGSTGGGSSSGKSGGQGASPSQSGTGPGKPGVVGAGGGGRPAGAGPGAPVVVGGSAVGAVPFTTGRDPLAAPKTTQLWWDGFKMPMNGGTSDGAEGEDRYGEWGGGLWGLGVLAGDAGSGLRSWEASRMGAVTKWQDDGGLEGAIYRGVAGVREAPVPYARQPAFSGSDEFGFANPRN